MKKFLKKLLCLSLAMLMVMFCLAGCGEEPVATDDDDGEHLSGNEDNGSNNGNGNNVAFGIEIKDTEALFALLGIDGINAEDLKLDVTAGKGGEYVIALAAKLFDENHDIKLFGGYNSLAVSSTLLDKAYGISDLKAFSENLKSQLVPEGSGQANSVVGGIASIDVATVTKFAEKYYNFIINELKNNCGLNVSEENGMTAISGKLSTDAMATIVVNTLFELRDDNDFYAIFGISKEDFTSGMPDKAALLSQFKQGLAEMPISVTINSLKVDSKNVLKAIDLKVEVTALENSPALTTTIAFDADAGTGKLELLCGEEYIKASIAPNKIAVDVDFTFTSEDYYGTSATAFKIKLNGDENGVNLDAKVTEKCDYPSWDETEKNVMSCTAELDKSHFKLVYETQEDYIYGGEDDPYEVASDFEKYEINATFSKAGGNASLKRTSQYTNTRYVEENRSSTVEITAKLTISDNSIKLELAQGDETIVAELADNGSEIVGSVKSNGEEMGNIKLGKKVEGTKTTYTLLSFTANKVTTDFSAVGISFYYDDNATLPGLSQYTVIDNMTTAELEEILEGIATRNEAFFNKFTEAFGDMGFSYEDDYPVQTQPNLNESVQVNGTNVI